MEKFIVLDNEIITLLCTKCGCVFDLPKTDLNQEIECKECDNVGKIN